MNAAELKKLTDWLMDGARSAPTPMALLAQTCERLVAAGLPLWRVAAFVKTLHPDMLGRSFVWRRGAEVVVGAPISTCRNRRSSFAARWPSFTTAATR